MTRSRIVALLVLCAVVLGCTPALAQEPRQAPRRERAFGLTASYPGSGGMIGLIWQTSNQTAFRPEFVFSSRFAGQNSPTESSNLGIAVTILRYVARKDAVSAFWGPRLSYSRTSSSATSSTSAQASTAGSAYSGGVSFGLQYDATRSIAVYGEIGASYSYQSTSYSSTPPLVPPPSPVTSHTIASRAAFGVNVYF